MASRTSARVTRSSSAAVSVSTSTSSGGDLQRDVARQLREPPDVAHDERLPEREPADHAARRLAHRRMAEVDEHVAACHERPEPRLVDPAFAREPVLGEPEALEPPVEVEARRRRPDEEQRQLGMLAPHVRRRAKQLRNPLARVHDAEAADHDAAPATRSGETVGAGQAGCGTTLIGPSNPAARARSRT